MMSTFYFYQHLPLYVSPVAFTIGSFSVRWYGVSYIVGFIVVYSVLMWRVKHDQYQKVISYQSSVIKNAEKKKDDLLPMTDDKNLILDFLLLAFFSALVGGRIGYVLFYNLPYYLSHPLAIISPYGGGANTLIGIYGMSSHGALLGVILASLVFLKKRKIIFLRWADFVVPAVALGYFFGRLGNFLNGELYGRVTTSFWGMYFLADPSNLRYPSQLLEAFLEGIILFAVLWKMRKLDLTEGSLFCVYLMGYATARIVAEFFREPDPQIGFIFGFLTMGQILSLLMALVGIILLFIIRKRKISV